MSALKKSSRREPLPPKASSPDGLVVIDNTPPVVAEALDVSGIKHVRMPFGAVQSNYESAQYAAALDANG